ncbi:MAG TPA: DNA repair protein RadC [Clostridiales bacterium]|jgi:DNA repair protein RadC|nr:DNA repair protein RadC [Clostridiales bacterium]
MAQGEKNIHAGHRERLKKRFLNGGLDGFEAHNVLELLLFFGVPQQDTNILAHRLIQRFSSLSKVLEAPYSELLEVPGMGPHTVTLLKLIPSLSRYYLKDRSSSKAMESGYEEIGSFLVRQYAGIENECVMGVFFDNGFHLQGCKVLHVGSVNSASFTLRCIADEVIMRKSSVVIIAHNHPHGLPLPSPDDLETTRRIEHFLSSCGIELAEHYIIAEHKFCGIVHARSLPAGQTAVREISWDTV